MLKTRDRGRNGERGQELVELALVLPLLVVLLAGTVEFGRAFYTYNILTKSVRNAARYLSASQVFSNGGVGEIPSTYSDRAKNLAVYGNVEGNLPKVISDLLTSQFTTSISSDVGAQFSVKVSADYTYSPLFGFVLPSFRMKPSVEMRFVGVVTYPQK